MIKILTEGSVCVVTYYVFEKCVYALLKRDSRIPTFDKCMGCFSTLQEAHNYCDNLNRGLKGDTDG